MDGVGGTTQGRHLGTKAAGAVFAHGGFRPNAGGAVSVFRGNMQGQFSVVETGTGIFTVTMTPVGFKWPRAPIIIPSAQCLDVTNTNRFQVFNVGGFVNSSRTFILQASQEETAFSPPANALTWIDFLMYGGTDRS